MREFGPKYTPIPASAPLVPLPEQAPSIKMTTVLSSLIFLLGSRAVAKYA